MGYPSAIDIEAGNENSIYVEVNNPNSLVYIGFATLQNDITFHLLKYISNDEQETEKKASEKNATEATAVEQQYDENMTDKGHFKSILKLERVDSSINPFKVRLVFFFFFFENRIILLFNFYLRK